MRHAILILILVAGPSWAYTAKQCDAMQTLIEGAMDMRLQGNPAQDAIRKAPEEAREAWAGLVAEIYDLDRRILTGAERADFLTVFYGRCLGEPDA